MVAESKNIALSFQSKLFGSVNLCWSAIRWWFFGFFLLMMGQTGISQITTFPSSVTPGQTFVPVPVVYFSPETNWAFGIRTSYTFHMDSLHQRPSTIQLSGLYTLRKQFASNLSFDLYRPEQRWELAGELGYYDYIYKYWGIGNQSSHDKETYAVQFPRLTLSPSFILSKYWRVGLIGDFHKYSRLRLDEDGLLHQLQTTGVAGGFVNGVGIQLRYDGRDHTLFPISGAYVSAQSVFYNPLWGSDYSFVASKLDVRHYQNIAGGLVWASQLLASIRSGPEIPFYHLSMLGGSHIMRGYFEGRYRNQNMWAVQSELRIPMWRRIFIVPFASAGDVFDFEDYRRSIKVAGGAGLRYIVDHPNRVTVRADVAYGQNFQFYLSILEAF